MTKLRARAPVGRVSECYALLQPRRTQGSAASGALSLSALAAAVHDDVIGSRSVWQLRYHTSNPTGRPQIVHSDLLREPCTSRFVSYLCDGCVPSRARVQKPLRSGRSTAVELVPSKAVEALPMQLRIGNRAALLAHTRLAERRVSLEQPLVLFALHDVSLRRPGW